VQPIFIDTGTKQQLT